ncbi:hypothetical protein D9615_000559 [Tricholomella constricta]|uniref:Alpha/beta hydrolase fold-3 domain-containing protein n=1 Tax=Tricholomella constricta TaxID=117010 RepID=A0A8H5HQ79_9AGAR|nr:hypothetical protein D9615_000559 [Tricholomella constricta]
MPVTTASAAVHIAPVVVKTFLNHGKRKAHNIGKTEEQDAKDDIFFDQAFHIVKAFIEMGTKNTVESLQAFTNTHVPAPFWAAVAPVLIPLSSCNRAADILIDWFGPDELKHVVGGERWWQVRGLDGIDAEWITEKEYLSTAKDHPHMNQKLSDDETTILRMDNLETVMLYVHGGGYFWGSINTHRYQIIRYARKFKGRAFAVNYRKAPQYPWPCPLQDVLAASHGTRLSLPQKLFLLEILQAAGFASLYSQSFETWDIIPQHGFLAKPSTLWPVDPLPQGPGRAVPSKSNPPPKPGHCDTLKPSKSRVSEAAHTDNITTNEGRIHTQLEMLHEHSSVSAGQGDGRRPFRHPSRKHGEEDADDYDVDFWEPKPPKVLMEDSNAVPLELRSQIQLYATTEQLSHPLVSPILQGSLGNLPPLYILAGNDEVLRDEIVYLAHRASHLSKYPARNGVLRDGKRQKENSERFTTPTKARYFPFIRGILADTRLPGSSSSPGMCHVLTVFSFTHSAKCAYRSIAEFVKHVSRYDADHLERNPFPELHRPPTKIHVDTEAHEDHPSALKASKNYLSRHGHEKKRQAGQKSSDPSDVKLYKRNEANVSEEVKHGQTDIMPEPQRVGSDDTLHASGRDKTKDIRNVLMIRERVDISGVSRPMEPPEEIPALNIRPGQVGLIKEAPTRRWLDGQEQWDKRFKRSAKRAIKRRVRLEAKAERILDNARLQGLIISGETTPQEKSTSIGLQHNKPDRIQDDRRWGPLDLDDERPPPSAIAKRRDTPEALALLKKSIYHTAPVTHKTVPRLRVSDAIRATFDPNDDPNRPPRQSVSEQQVRTHVIPVHGLRMWDGIVRYFGKETSKKALRGTKQVGEQLGIVKSDN